MSKMPTELSKAIGARLKLARSKKGLTQDKAAVKLGIPKSQTISAYETGTNYPPIDRLMDMCQLYGVSSDFILFGSNSPIKRTSKEYLEQLIEAVDHFGFRIRPEQEINNGTIPGRAIGWDPDLVELDPHIFSEDHLQEISVDSRDFDSFVSQWIQLRKSLQVDAMDQEDYKHLLAKKINALDDDVFPIIFPKEGEDQIELDYFDEEPPFDV